MKATLFLQLTYQPRKESFDPKVPRGGPDELAAWKAASRGGLSQWVRERLNQPDPLAIAFANMMVNVPFPKTNEEREQQMNATYTLKPGQSHRDAVNEAIRKANKKAPPVEG